MEKQNILVRFKNVSFFYEPKRPVLNNISFELKEGERIGLMGANGSGKTTFLQLIVGLLHPRSGTIEIFSRLREKEADFLEVRRRIGFLFQNAEDQLFCPTVAEDVAFGPLNLGKTQEEGKQITKQTLQKIGLSGYEERITYKLSGGEKRLVSLATVLAMEPEILLLDEPTYGLDEDSEKRILTVLANLYQPMIVISHHRDFLQQITERTAVLRNGNLV